MAAMVASTKQWDRLFRDLYSLNSPPAMTQCLIPPLWLSASNLRVPVNVPSAPLLDESEDQTDLDFEDVRHESPTDESTGIPYAIHVSLEGETDLGKYINDKLA